MDTKEKKKKKKKNEITQTTKATSTRTETRKRYGTCKERVDRQQKHNAMTHIENGKATNTHEK